MSCSRRGPSGGWWRRSSAWGTFTTWSTTCTRRSRTPTGRGWPGGWTPTWRERASARSGSGSEGEHLLSALSVCGEQFFALGQKPHQSGSVEPLQGGSSLSGEPTLGNEVTKASLLTPTAWMVCRSTTPSQLTSGFAKYGRTTKPRWPCSSDTTTSAASVRRARPHRRLKLDWPNGRGQCGNYCQRLASFARMPSAGLQ
jgi:hypothetical protein